MRMKRTRNVPQTASAGKEARDRLANLMKEKLGHAMSKAEEGVINWDGWAPTYNTFEAK